jgi:hypothetical protein
MKITHGKLRKIIEEEVSQLLEASQWQAPEAEAGQEIRNLSDPLGDDEQLLEEILSEEMRKVFTDIINGEQYESRPPESEVNNAAMAFEVALVDTAALRDVMRIFSDVERGLYKREYIKQGAGLPGPPAESSELTSDDASKLRDLVDDAIGDALSDDPPLR